MTIYITISQTSISGIYQSSSIIMMHFSISLRANSEYFFLCPKLMVSIGKVIVQPHFQYQVYTPETDLYEIYRNSRYSNTHIHLTLERILLSSTFSKIWNFLYTGEHRIFNCFTRFSEVNFVVDHNSRMYENPQKNKS